MRTNSRSGHGARWLAVVALLITSFASAQTSDRSPLVRLSGESPFRDCLADDVTRQPGHLTLGGEVEPRLAVNPRNPANMAATFQQDRWSNGGARGLLTATSFDGGRTWHSVVVPGLSLCGGGGYRRATDPWLSFAPNGVLYHAGLAVDVNLHAQPGETERPSPDRPPVRNPALSDSAVLVSRSFDGGLRWEAPLTIDATAGDGDFDDKESITADPTDPSSKLVYIAWTLFAPALSDRPTDRAMFSRTTDGGEHWEEPRVLYEPPLHGAAHGCQVLVLPNGLLAAFFTEYEPYYYEGELYYNVRLSLLRSADKGKTWSPSGPPLRTSSMSPVGVTDPRTGLPVRTGAGLVDVAVDRKTGQLYAVWADEDRSASSADPSTRFRFGSIALSTSRDEGLHWARLEGHGSINKTPTGLDPRLRQAFTPSVYVAPDSTVGVTYYDFRNTNLSGSSTAVDYWLVRCRPRPDRPCDDPSNWGDEVRLASFAIEQAPRSRGYFLGDYQGLAADGDGFLALFSQPHDRDPASIFFRRVGR